MGIQTVMVPKLLCERCGHTWIPRIQTKPVCCANRKCNSPYWDRPRLKPKLASPGNNGGDPAK